MTDSSAAMKPEGLHWIDGAIIAAYACSMMGLGWYYSRKQASTDEYFVGNRTMNPFLIGISLFATLLSTITYLSSPGEMVRHGPAAFVGVFAIPISYLIVGYVLIPVFMRQRVTSAYELLELKLGLAARLTGATMFIVLRLMWMSVLIYFASKAMLAMMGLEGQMALFGITLVTGAVAVVYSSLGGLRAVVITDLLQFLLLFGGAVLVVVVISMRLGGLSWFPTEWPPHWDTQPIFSFDPHVRLTVVGVVVMQMLWTICTAGGDQTAVQRYMATRDARAARRSYLTNSIASVAVLCVLALVGLALSGYFHARPELFPPEISVTHNADLLFPHFIANHLPVGISGLVVSGMFAAAMSSVDSGVNSISAVVMTDYIDRLTGRPLQGKQHVRAAQAVAFGVGVFVVGASVLMEYVPGNFLEVSKRVTGLLVTPLFALFFMALFIPWATQWGTVLGAFGGFLVAGLVAFWEPLTGRQEISFTWINPSALTAGLVIACVASWIERRFRVVSEGGGLHANE